jgi:hypothetical protein
MPPASPEPQPAAAVAPPGPHPAASAAPGERVVAVIGNLTEVAGFMGVKSKTYTLVITDQRLIFARLTKERMNAIVAQARDEAKAAGKGFFGQWGAQLGSSFNYHELYSQMTPEEALAETPDNYAIDRSTIVSVKYKTGTMDENGASTPDRVIIKTASGKHKIQVNGSLRAVKDTLRQAGIV